MKNILTLLFSATLFNCQAQEVERFNLGFEIGEGRFKLSEGWMKWGNYELGLDSMSHSGNRSVKITSDETGSAFGSIAFSVPAKYQGESIKLEGFMKIKNVENGFAGLLLRIDGNGTGLAFDNMQSQDVKGTKDWEKYSITLDYPEGADIIYVAGILVGKGEAWFDDFVLSIDGESVQTLEKVEKPKLKAQLDTEFDNGSGIEVSGLTSSRILDLELLGRVWGLLKYHHPEIAVGNKNWDYELFRFLPKYLKVQNSNERDNLIIDWIGELGRVGKCTICKIGNKNAFLKPDLGWIESQDDVLKVELESISSHLRYGQHYYIKMFSNVGNPEFRNERAYSYMPYPDDGFRLLSVFRYWNMINYFFPYRHLMDEDWNLKLKEYIPVFLNSKNELEYEMAALQMIADIKDTHANLWGGGDKIDEWKGNFFPPFQVRFIENKLVVVDYYNSELKVEAGLEVGDIIAEIDGKTVEQIVEEKSKYYPASNVPTRLRNISVDILRSNSEEIKVQYSSGSSIPKLKTLKLYPKDSLDIRLFKDRDEKSFKMLNDVIGYISLQNIIDGDLSKIKEEFKDTKGIIIDIRNYPSTFVVFSLGSYFVSSSTPFVKFTIGNAENPGEFAFGNTLSIPSDSNTYKGKLVVLVNELTQSSAEYHAMAFRAAENTTIVGSTTAGADGNISRISLPGGLNTMISGIGVYYPDGTATQRVGIVPDIEVKPTVQGIREGRDELLDYAIELIMKK